MPAPTEIVPTRDLVPGMYVTQLDRPWLETPFLFQGFKIKTEAEVAELRRYCEYVYVESAGTAGDAGEPGPGAPSPRPGEFYADTAEASVELPRARHIFEESSTLFVDTMERVRSGGTLSAETLESAVTPMMESLLRNQGAMTWLTRIKRTDDYTYGHSVSCAVYGIAFGRHLGLPREDLKTLGLGGLLLDVGKTRIPRALLAKPGPLTAEELQLMRRHVQLGLDILEQDADLDRRVLEMVRSHHERYDGSGYPDGLEGPAIPVFARIAGIVDCYDALITPRVYAPAISTFDAMRTLNRGAGREFQSEMVEQFVQAMGVFPNGALVELSTGEVGVVVEQNRVRRLRPKLVVILDRDKQPLPEPEALDLRERPAEPNDPSAVWIERGLEAGAYGIDAGRYFL